MSGLHDALAALADDWGDFEHDMVACSDYRCPDCTMKNAEHDVRALLAEHPPADAPALDGPSYGDYWPPADLPVQPRRDEAINVMAYLEGWLSNEWPDVSRYLREHMTEIADQMVDDDCASADLTVATGDAGTEVVYGVLLDDAGSIDQYDTREEAEQMLTSLGGLGLVRITQERLASSAAGSSPEDAGDRVGLSEAKVLRVVQRLFDHLAAVEQERDRAVLDAGGWRTTLNIERAEAAALREQVAAVAALHGVTHWCFGGADLTDLRDEVVFEPGTEHWPCPTAAALAEPASVLDQVRGEARAKALRDAATSFREAELSGYLFVGPSGQRVPWEDVALRLEALANLPARGLGCEGRPGWHSWTEHHQHVATEQAAALRAAGLVVEGTEVEDRWVPIDEHGERWAPRTKEEAEWTMAHCPAGGDDMPGIVRIVHEQRRVTEWVAVDEGGE